MKYLNYKVLLAGLGFIVLSLLCFLSINTYITDSEIWAVSSSKDFPFAFERSSYFLKPLFHMYLKVPFLFELSSWNTHLFARIQFALFGGAIALLTFLIGIKVGGNKKVGFISLFLFCTSSLFISRGFRIRSDLMAAFFFYLCLYLSFCNLNKKWLSVFYTGSLCAMILSTPKSIFMALLLFFRRGSKVKEVRFDEKTVRPLFLLGYGTLCIFFLFPYFKNSLVDIYQYILVSFTGSNSNYMNKADFFHVNLFVRRNFIFFIGIVLSFLLNYFFYRGEKKQKNWYVITLLATLVVILYPNKRPFFLLSYLPIYAVSTGLLVEGLQRVSLKINEVKTLRITLAVLIFAVLWGTFKNLKVNLNHKSDEQKVLTTEFEKYFDEHKTRNYYDAFGVLPRRKFVAGFIGPEDTNRKVERLEKVLQENPELFLYTGKVALQKNYLRPFLLKNYIQLGHSIWGVSHPVSMDTMMSFFEWNGKKYRKLNLLSLKEKVKESSQWKYISLAYGEEGEYPHFREVLVKKRGSEIVPFTGSARKSEIELILVPQKVTQVRVSRFPMAVFPTQSNFNKDFRYDVLY